MDSLAIQNAGTAHKKLWRAVIDSAITEWVRGPVRLRRTAEYFLFHDENDFPFVCRSAGLNSESVRESLWAIRAQTVSEPIPAVVQRQIPTGFCETEDPQGNLLHNP